MVRLFLRSTTRCKPTLPTLMCHRGAVALYLVHARLVPFDHVVSRWLVCSVRALGLVAEVLSATAGVRKGTPKTTTWSWADLGGSRHLARSSTSELTRSGARQGDERNARKGRAPCQVGSMFCELSTDGSSVVALLHHSFSDLPKNKIARRARSSLGTGRRLGSWWRAYFPSSRSK